MQNADASAPIYVGLMSGTSMDGIDAVLVRFTDQGGRRCNILESYHQAYPETLRKELTTSIRSPGEFSVDTLGSLDHQVALCFANAAQTLLANANTNSTQVTAIGSHGQTVRHQPNAEFPFTLQIGDPNVIAARTGITTVADFRRRDIALGGEGAPLAPAFHDWFFSDVNERRVVLNIGGIANVTILNGDADSTIGFDTGPGNTLLDAWIQKSRGESFDGSGAFAETGDVMPDLLNALLSDPYLNASPPKSTGFEYFNLQWLQQHIEQCDFSRTPDAAGIQATLAEFTARSISDAIRCHAPGTERIMVCGGGVHNIDLMARLRRIIQDVPVASTMDSGLDPDWVEAAAFAWLAMRTLKKQPGNLPTVTGASHAAILGGVFAGAQSF